jgi:hypothetical protein
MTLSAATEYQVVHRTSRRLRLRVPRLQEDLDYATTIEEQVTALKGVTAVRLNRAAASLIVHFRPIPGTAPIEPQVVACLERLTAPAAEEAHRPAASTDAQTSTETVLDTEDSGIEDSSTEESGIEDSDTEESGVTDRPTDPGTSPVPSLSQGDLANRLGIASQAITPRRNQASFPDWSRELDPENIGWCYRASASCFEPVPTVNQGSLADEDNQQLEDHASSA